MNADSRFKAKVCAATDPTKRSADLPPAPALTDPDAFEGQEIICERDTAGYPMVWIVVLRRAKDGTWAYRIVDCREAYMRKVGGLTSTPAHALATRGPDGFEDPVVPPDYQAKLDDAAEKPSKRMRQQRRYDSEALTAERRTLENRLGLARKVAEVRKVDISTHERVIEDRLRRIEKQLTAAEAA